MLAEAQGVDARVLTEVEVQRRGAGLLAAAEAQTPVLAGVGGGAAHGTTGVGWFVGGEKGCDRASITRVEKYRMASAVGLKTTHLDCWAFGIFNFSGCLGYSGSDIVFQISLNNFGNSELLPEKAIGIFGFG